MKINQLPAVIFGLGLTLTLGLFVPISQAAPPTRPPLRPGNPVTNPISNTHTAPPTTTISVTYDEPIDPASVSPQTFAVQARQTGLLMGAYSVDDGTVSLTPTQPLRPGELVQVSATTDILSLLDGNGPLSPTVWEFRTAVGGGDGLYEDSGQRLASSYGVEAALGDLDGDGDLDAFVVNGGGQANRVWLNDGTGAFHDSGQRLSGPWNHGVALGDLDGDGDLDAFVVNTANHPNQVWLNDGTGTFHDSGQRLGGSRSNGVALGDFDGDGDLDAFIANYYTGQPNRVWLNNGSGTFHDSGQRLGNSSGYSVTVGDLDGDGDLDAFVGNSYGQANRVWLNDGTGTFHSNGQGLGGSYSWSVELGDVDGDGDLDAFVANTSNQANRVWLNNGAGTFHDSGQRLGNSYSNGVELGDVDGDGDLDAFVADWNNQANRVWLNNGAGTFHDSGLRLGNSSSHNVALGDLDGDGDLDAFATNGPNQADRVWLNPPQGVSASFTTSSPDVLGETTIFTNTSTGSNLSFEWDFGDGSPIETTISPTHTYVITGTFTVVLTATNSTDSDTASAIVLIEDPPPPPDPISGLTASNDGPTTLGVATALTATIETGSDVSYVWDFGDGSAPDSSGPIVSHTYSEVGTFTAVVTASNSVSSQAATTSVIIQDVPPVASFSTSSPDILGEVTTFSNTSTGSNLSFEWNLGDGGPVETAVNPTHTYATTGTFTVILTATNSVGSDTTSDQVVIEDPPPTLRGYWGLDEPSGQRQDSSGYANHLTDNNTVGSTTGQMGLAADFESDDQGYLSINDADQSGLDITGSLTLVGWVNAETLERYQIMASKYEYGVDNRAYRFGLRPGDVVGFVVSPDGSLSTEYLLEASAPYPLYPGTWYHVAGVFDTEGRSLSIYLDGDLIGSRSVDYESIYHSSAPFMLGAGMNDGQVTRHFDGQLDEWHVFAEALSESEIEDLMLLTQEPISGLTAGNDGPTALGDATTLTAAISSGSNVSYVWDFGDGSPLNEGGPVVSHTYPAIGAFTVVVTASNDVSSQTATTTVTVQELPPVAGFSTSSPDVLGEVTTFTNESTGSNLSYEWDFGDGSPISTDVHPTHTYASTGTFTVVLTATNSLGGDTFSGQVLIEAAPPTLRGHWTLDEAGGQRQDSSGYGNHLTDNNTVGSTTGQMGLAADFESDDQEYLSINDADQDGLDITGSLTLVGWVNAETLEIAQIMASKYEYGVNNRAYRFDLRAGNTLRFVVSPDGSFGTAYLLEARPPFQMSPGTWYHVAGVFDAEGRTLSIYLDGDLIGTRSVDYEGIYNSSAPFMLGAGLVNGEVTQYFDGQLDEWHVFAEALLESEIEDLMILTQEPISGLTATNDGPTALGDVTTLTAAISSGSNVSYVWDFGDGSPLNGGGPVMGHTYLEVGTFTAVITASNDVSTQSATTTVTVQEVPPGAAFTSSSPDVLGEVTSFSNTSTGSNLSYEWDFGDGSPVSTETHPTHTYATTGTFTVVLTATNSAGSDTASDQVVIEAAPPILRGHWTLDEAGGQRQDSSGYGNHLTDHNTVGSAVGQIGLAADFERDNHEYLSIGDAPQDGLDITGSLTLVGWVNAETLEIAQIMASKYEYGVNNRAYRFDLRAGNTLRFVVSPDGSFGTAYLLEAHPPSALSPGTWYHVAGVFDAEGRTLSIYLDGDLIGTRSVDYEGIYNSSAPFMLGAGLVSGEVTQYFDGQLDEWYVFAKALSESEIEDLMVLTQEPISGLTATNDGPTALGDATTLTATIETGSNVSYVWDFGDGSPLDEGGPIVSHTYSEVGTYTAVVTASNDVSSQTATTTVTVQELPPEAAFSTSSPDVLGEVTTFTNESTGGNLSFEWDFGDGSPIETAVNPTHTYATTGTFTVALTAVNSAGSDTTSDQVVIEASPPTLRGHWNLDEAGGQRQDGSGYANHLTDNNTVGSALGQIGLAADFESDNHEYLSINHTDQDGLDITGSLTLVGWVNAERVGRYQIMASKYEYGVDNRAYRFGLRPGDVVGFVVSPDGSLSTEYLLEASAPYPLYPGTWYHVAGVFDAEGRSLSIYLDGDLIGTRSVDYESIYHSSAPFMLGAGMNNGQVTRHFDGQLDEWYIFAEALSESEIEDLMVLSQEPISGLTSTNDGPTALGDATTLTAAISSGSNVSYVWDFGDGSPLDEGGPVVGHTYPAVGAFTAVVTASNDVSSQTATTTVTVQEVPPVAAFTSSSPDVLGEVTSFTNESTGSNLSYEWDFGDGSPISTDVHPTHTYASTGTFTVVLTATNSLGADTFSNQILIEAAPPTLRGHWSLDEADGQRQDSTGYANHLTDNNTVGSALGQIGLAADFESDNGEYLSISHADQDGLDITGSLTLVGWVNAERLERRQIMAAKYEYGVNNRAYRFELRPGDILRFVVSPDGSFSDEYFLAVSPPISLSTGTWYHVAAVFDAEGRTLTIYLDGDLIGSRSVDYDTIYDSSVPFMLGAGMGYGQVTQHFDGQLDEWYVFAEALSESEIEDLMALAQQEPVSGLTASNDGPTPLGDTTTLTAAIETGSDVGYAWDFGDGSPPDEGSPTVGHTYPEVGTFTATVTASNDVSSQSATTTVIIQDVPPVAGFSSTSPDVMGETTVFTNTSTGSDLSFEWNFGDDSPVSTDVNPTHTYATTGTFTVVLTAANSAGADTASAQVVIEEPPPSSEPISGLAADNDGPTTLGDATTLTATIETGSDVSYVWDFGDGSPLDEGGPVVGHTYPEVGTFTAVVTASNSVNTQSATTTVIIQDVPPAADFSSTSPDVLGETTTFTNTSTGTHLTFEWNFGDGSPISADTHPTHTYVTTGTFTVVLTAANSIGSNTASDQVVIEDSPSNPEPISGLTATNLEVAYISVGGSYNGWRSTARNGSTYGVRFRY